MSRLTMLIDELTHATQQLQQMSLSDDWTLAERLQKRRAALLEQIGELAHTRTISDAQAAQLQTIRALDAQIKSRACARLQTFGDALAQLRTGSPPAPQSANRMRAAYSGR